MTTTQPLRPAFASRHVKLNRRAFLRRTLRWFEECYLIVNSSLPSDP